MIKCEQLCKECSNWCCKIYLDPAEGGQSEECGGTRDTNEWWETWVSLFHEERDNYSVKPLYDAEEAHLVQYEHWNTPETIEYHKKLRERGINKDFCEYRGANGCILSEEERPISCKNFMCLKMKNSLYGQYLKFLESHINLEEIKEIIIKNISESKEKIRLATTKEKDAFITGEDEEVSSWISLNMDLAQLEDYVPQGFIIEEENLFYLLKKAILYKYASLFEADDEFIVCMHIDCMYINSCSHEKVSEERKSVFMNLKVIKRTKGISSF